MFISGTSGNVMYDEQLRKPFMHDGRMLKLNFSKPIYQLTLQQQAGGTISGSPVSGASGTTFNLSATSNNKYTFDGFSVTGTTLTGSAGTYTNSDVTAKGNWTYHPEPVFDRWVSGYVDYPGSLSTNIRVGSALLTYPLTLADDEVVAVSALNIPCHGIGWANVYYRDDVSGQHQGVGTDWTIFKDYVAASANPPIYLTPYTASFGSRLYSGYVYLSAHSGGFYKTTEATTPIGKRTAYWAGAVYKMV